jgi:hypothetical protein
MAQLLLQKETLEEQDIAALRVQIASRRHRGSVEHARCCDCGSLTNLIKSRLQRTHLISRSLGWILLFFDI